MTEAQGGSSENTQLTTDKKRIIARSKVETGHSENVIAAWFKRKTDKEIYRSVVGKSVRPGFHELDIDGPETENVETIAEIAARLLGRETAEEDDAWRARLQLRETSASVTRWKKQRGALCVFQSLWETI